jgi:hypothetical protein
MRCSASNLLASANVAVGSMVTTSLPLLANIALTIIRVASLLRDCSVALEAPASHAGQASAER